MTDFYNHGSAPADNSFGDPAVIRAEFDAIVTGISNKLAPLTGNPDKIVAVNPGATAYTSVASTGTGSVVRATSPTLVTPNLGTPSTLVLTNATGLPATGVANTPAGNIAATNVQAALNELDAEKTTTAFVLANIVGAYGSRALVGVVNAGTPLTKYDLSAESVVLRDAANNTIVRTAVGATTCDLGLAGSSANGRDQAGAFGASNWIYLYFIWNGTTLATLASLTAPPTGPTLPSGYTHWCYATAVRWNASSNIIPMRTNGHFTWYDITGGGVTQVLTGGVATTMTAVSLAGFVPPNAIQVHLSCILSLNHNVVAEFLAQLRPTGASNAGTTYAAVESGAGVQSDAWNTFLFPLGTTQQIDYKMNIAPFSTGGVYLQVIGFVLSNGG